MSRSHQEEIINNISPFILGRQALFFPELYGKNANEPADLAWVVGDCAILIYMTSGRKSYEKQKQHNLKQMVRWLRAWKGGQVLAGESFNKKVCYSLSSIRHVVGISIVECDDAICEYHEEFTDRYSNFNLVCCATISNNIMQLFASRLLFPRDIIRLFSILKYLNRAVSQKEFAEIISNYYIDLFERQRSNFSNYLNAYNFETDAYSDALRLFEQLKSYGVPSEVVSTAFCDLDMEDMFWFAYASRVGESSISIPEVRGQLSVVSFERGCAPFKLRCVVASNSEALVDNLSIINHNEARLTLNIIFDIGRISPIRMINVSKNPLISLLGRDLDSCKMGFSYI